MAVAELIAQHQFALRENVIEDPLPGEVQVRVEQARVRQGESNIVYGSNRKIRRATSWVPEIDLMTTLRDLYLYWGEVLAAQAR